ncbi:hypothetical protein CONLIGDRAFT_612403 [Coniochaeta ligniaria NRRL 30616]|uniref:Uncharacterized protein n=1 Tax=Coniochaeta ligniaria NRRL 30616 TaxID=1408157 RepID=A0A1J7IWH3_9PEZI|nr:hypothetical protein CONLIGDRAFT_612403 [Coniochaeta ligniaria NRRL 30616]
MDPISALGLAANVLQFLQFTTGLFGSAQRLYVSASDASADCQHLENVYSRLSELNVALQTSQSRTASTAQPSSHWDNLKALAQKCDSDCQELLSATAKLKVKNAPKRRWWKCFHKALLEVWTQEELRRIKCRIEDYQGSMTVYLCAISAEGIETIKLDLDQLKADTRTLHAGRTQQLELLVQSMARVTRDLTAIKDASVTGHVRLDEMEVLTGKLAGLCLNGRRLAVEQNILTSLDFAHRSQRQMAIPDAHLNTFSWVSETQSDVTSGPGKFALWLQEGSGVFWVSGKPGSGKSTFMKHVTHNKHTRAALSRWARPKQLVVASYYFWSAGQLLQKSLYGLLRSLLHDILDQVPGASHDVCSRLWEEDNPGEVIGKEWSLSELHDCLQKLSKQNTLQSRFCLFIDGLDEYDGDHIEICRTLLTLCQSADFKICVASRPWNVFETELGKNELQKLYIHELTQDDIRKYVTDRLHQHPQWSEACSEDVRSHTLVQEIAERSHGVFLWVFLVTRQLREGLVNGDTFDDLLKRLESIPTDLEQFFKHILDSVDPFYHVNMARTLQIALVAVDNRGFPVPILAFHDMEYHDTDYALNQPVIPFTPEEAREFLRPTRRRLNGRCKGLLEIHNDSIQFLHRTLWDFLKTGEMASYLSNKAGSQFSANTSLLKAYVAFLKRGRSWDLPDKHCSHFVRIVADRSWGKKADDILRTLLGYAMQIQSYENKEYHATNTHFCSLWNPFRLQTLNRLLENGISANETYVVPGTGEISTPWHALVCSLAPWTDHGLALKGGTRELQSAFDSGAISLLLQHGADVNASNDPSYGISLPVWLRFFLLLFFNPGISTFTYSYIETLRAMMLSAADFSVLFQENWPSKSTNLSYISPWKVLCDQLDYAYTQRSHLPYHHLGLCSQAIEVLALTAAGKVTLPWGDMRSILQNLFGSDFLDQLLDADRVVDAKHTAMTSPFRGWMSWPSMALP